MILIYKFSDYQSINFKEVNIVPYWLVWLIIILPIGELVQKHLLFVSFQILLIPDYTGLTGENWVFWPVKLIRADKEKTRKTYH